MQINLARPHELGPAEIGAWREMQRSTAALRNPFLSPEFALAVGRVRPGARVAVLSDGPAVIGFFPFERRRLGAGVPIAAELTDCQGLVHVPGAQWDAGALLRGCGLAVWEFGHLVQDQLPFRPFVAATAPSPVVELADGFESYHAKLKVSSAQFCRNVERKARKLSREVGPVRLEVHADDRLALRALMGWKSDQYQRTGRPDRFAQPWVVQLIDQLAAADGPDFRGLFSVLYAGDVPVAGHFGIRCGPVLAHWFPAYDPAYAKYSPGLVQHLRMIEGMAAQGVELIDLGKGAKHYKEVLKTGDLFVAEGAVTRATPLAALHRARIITSQWGIRTIRANPRLFAAADQALRRYGQARRRAARRHRASGPA